MTPTPTGQPHPSPDPLAGLLAFALPGLGHIYRGETARGLLAAAGVLGLILSGCLIGGIDVIDRKEDRWWFVGQALAGPVVFGLDWVNQSQLKAWGQPPAGGEARLRSGFPGEARTFDDASRRWVWRRADNATPPSTKALAKVNEIGTLYVLCAGMMNLIITLDALLPARPAPRRQRTR